MYMKINFLPQSLSSFHSIIREQHGNGKHLPNSNRKWIENAFFFFTAHNRRKHWNSIENFSWTASAFLQWPTPDAKTTRWKEWRRKKKYHSAIEYALISVQLQCIKLSTGNGHERKSQTLSINNIIQSYDIRHTTYDKRET